MMMPGGWGWGWGWGSHVRGFVCRRVGFGGRKAPCCTATGEQCPGGLTKGVHVARGAELAEPQQLGGHVGHLAAGRQQAAGVSEGRRGIAALARARACVVWAVPNMKPASPKLRFQPPTAAHRADGARGAVRLADLEHAAQPKVSDLRGHGGQRTTGGRSWRWTWPSSFSVHQAHRNTRPRPAPTPTRPPWLRARTAPSRSTRAARWRPSGRRAARCGSAGRRGPRRCPAAARERARCRARRAGRACRCAPRRRACRRRRTRRPVGGEWWVGGG
jgi:hypothetical protein